MWTLFLVAGSTLVGVSSSPYIGVLCLVGLALGLSFKIGLHFLNWFFFTLIVVYVGGMMVMFIYLSSLTQSAKMTLVGPRGYLWSSLVLVLLTAMTILSPASGWHSWGWVSVSFSLSGAPLASLGAIYLFGALISVFRLCEKKEGPMKSTF